MSRIDALTEDLAAAQWQLERALADRRPRAVIAERRQIATALRDALTTELQAEERMFKRLRTTPGGWA